MSTTIRTIAAFFLLPVFHANAAIIDQGDYFTDTTSGLDWLDLSFSVGEAYNEVIEGFVDGGTFAGYRHATSNEINQLMSNAVGYAIADTDFSSDYVALPETNNLSAADWLNDLFTSTYDGLTSEGNDYRYVFGTIADESSDPQGGRHRTAMIYDDDRVTDSPDWFKINDLGTRDGATYDRIGHFLVRDAMSVPAPATFSLFALGMLILGISRQRLPLIHCHKHSD